jgi:phosphoribosylaminoimidazolecarboxamide formyltransferase/IMP cyclohydrolase
VVIAPGATDAARAIFAAKKNLRLLTTEGLPDPAVPGLAFRQVAGGFLVQDRDSQPLCPKNLKVVTKRAPSDAEMADLLFAWKVAKHVKSNAIVYVKGGATVGVGAGQMSRVDSTRIAARKAEDMAATLGLAQSPDHRQRRRLGRLLPLPRRPSDRRRRGATAVIQPGGSMNDQAVIDAATRRAWPWSSPASAISGTDRCAPPPSPPLPPSRWTRRPSWAFWSA